MDCFFVLLFSFRFTNMNEINTDEAGGEEVL